MQEMHLEILLPGIVPFMESGHVDHSHLVGLAQFTFVEAASLWHSRWPIPS